jgi:NAD(P)-dependent dehydrogenase (short-subunit alcohol dehydrogenase family)
LRSIIITGANSGIGLGIAEALVGMGERLAFFDLSGIICHQRRQTCGSTLVM